ncbi:MAG: transporter [Candidatus Rokubacteria bacterium RIFCSPHIGHO2_12_FULL_73_22]|nr:MAG: transporter [Candidatus Rokubacteria bacterium RIFCSPHIGHO2_02_FULL_73_26]OGL00856.1 MAG: transporter [Candidatus Rokubacteria bacterium RIFCSPHIGHO2_12_FULL_73_22]OGL11868.1 MAG: transporter [Candidatus Rokubacteria bacterium RIFCSPLOWO2_02_FULL_73_56]OGL28231.1 MAG: transporter [Candidatus Rokubacteria bacterium RIFCSPLOWO2_12_FULL_73_47]
MGSRLHGIIAKEFIQLGRDRLALTLMLFVPVVMLFIFGWAINTDVKHVPTVVLEQSGSVEAQQLLEALENSQYFDLRYRVRSQREMTRMIDDGTAKVGVVIPPDYARQLARRRARVQVIVDASDPQVATSAMNTATALAAARSLAVLAQTSGGTVVRDEAPPLDFRVRAWYNPDLVSAIFIVPGLIGALLMQTTVSVMAIAIVRERERGTLEALVVSPIRRWELLLGKIIPNLLVAYGQMTMALLVAHFVFDVPVRGSLPLLYGLSAVFMWGTLGIGIFVSAASRTVPQAMQLSFMTFLPSIYLSGLLFPIEGMPRGAQYLAAVIPLTYYLRIVRGIVLKGIGFEYLWPHVLPLLVFGAVVFTLSVLRFRKQLD